MGPLGRVVQGSSFQKKFSPLSSSDLPTNPRQVPDSNAIRQPHYDAAAFVLPNTDGLGSVPSMRGLGPSPMMMSPMMAPPSMTPSIPPSMPPPPPQMMNPMMPAPPNPMMAPSAPMMGQNPMMPRRRF